MIGDSTDRAAGWPAKVRVPLKMMAFALVVLAVCFPYPRMFLRHLDHVTHLERMIEPNAPELAAFEAEFHKFESQQEAQRQRAAAAQKKRGTRVRKDVVTPEVAAAGASAASSKPAAKARRRAVEVQKDVEAFVYEKVNYDWDWNIWGMADYMPTVSEMFAKAKEYPDGQIREDCDGRAVMAASLLKRLGYESMILTDFGHVWVAVKQDHHQVELMGPGHVKAIVSTKNGNKVNVTWAMLENIPVALGFGLSVFPWLREAIVFVTLVLLLSHVRMGWRSFAVGVLLMFAGWHLVRGNTDYWGGQMLPFYMGLGYVLAGMGVMMAASRKARREAGVQQAS